MSESWFSVLRDVFTSKWWEETVLTLLRKSVGGTEVCPSSKVTDLCRALYDLKPDEVKVVILGQDPYHSEVFDWTSAQMIRVANGRAFSVPKMLAVAEYPPSLANIFKELVHDIDRMPPRNGTLDGWVTQGVLLLNIHLSTERGKAMAHKDLNWPTLTSAVLKYLDNREKPVVFVAWGREAQKFLHENVKSDKHRFVESAHPSPLSAHRGFFGSKPFSKINAFLQEFGEKQIDWSKT